MEIRQDGDTLWLRAQESFVVSNTSRLKPQIFNALQLLEAGQVILDLTHIDVMDSMGIKLVVSLYQTCTSQGLTFRIVLTSVNLRHLFVVCKLDHLIDLQVPNSLPFSSQAFSH